MNNVVGTLTKLKVSRRENVQYTAEIVTAKCRYIVFGHWIKMSLR